MHVTAKDMHVSLADVATLHSPYLITTFFLGLRQQASIMQHADGVDAEGRHSLLNDLRAPDHLVSCRDPEKVPDGVNQINPEPEDAPNLCIACTVIHPSTQARHEVCQESHHSGKLCRPPSSGNSTLLCLPVRMHV